MDQRPLMAATEVRHNRDRSRYEISLDGELVGVAEYETDGAMTVFTHTVMDPSLRDQGLGAVLVRDALDDVRANGGMVVAQCWYVAQFIDEHSEYADMLAS